MTNITVRKEKKREDPVIIMPLKQSPKYEKYKLNKLNSI